MLDGVPEVRGRGSKVLRLDCETITALSPFLDGTGGLLDYRIHRFLVVRDLHDLERMSGVVGELEAGTYLDHGPGLTCIAHASSIADIRSIRKR